MRPTPGLLVIGLLCSATLASAAGAPITGGILVSDRPATLLGAATAHADEATLWLSDPSPQAARTLLETDAGRMELHHYQHEATLGSGDASLYSMEALQYDLEPRGLSDAVIEVEALGPDATLRIRFAGPVDAQVSDPMRVHPDAHGADEPDVQRRADIGGAPGIDRFTTVPTDHRLLVGHGITATADVAFEMLFHDVVLRISDGHGNERVDGRVRSTGTMTDPDAQLRSWTDVVVQIPAGGLLRIDWPGRGALMATQPELDITGSLGLRAANGHLDLDGTRQAVASEAVRIEGPVAASIAGAQGGAQYQFTTVTPAGGDAAAMQPDSIDGTALALVVAATFMAAGAAAWIGVRRRVRASATSPAHPHHVAAATSAARQGAASAADAAGLDTDQRVTDTVAAAQAAFERRDWQEAARLFKDAPDANADDPAVRYGLGVSLLHLGRFNSGFRHLQVAVRQDPLYLQLLVTRPETESIRMESRFAAFMRKEARVFQAATDAQHVGYC